MTGEPDQDLGARLEAERRRAAAQVEQLQEQFDAIVDASRDTAADDEHDPDGATIGFERAQVASLLERARRRLAQLDDAIARLQRGDYGTCEQCGQPIAAERLAALPSATQCVNCASTARRQL